MFENKNKWNSHLFHEYKYIYHNGLCRPRKHENYFEFFRVLLYDKKMPISMILKGAKYWITFNVGTQFSSKLQVSIASSFFSKGKLLVDLGRNYFFSFDQNPDSPKTAKRFFKFAHIVIQTHIASPRLPSFFQRTSEKLKTPTISTKKNTDCAKNK